VAHDRVQLNKELISLGSQTLEGYLNFIRVNQRSFLIESSIEKIQRSILNFKSDDNIHEPVKKWLSNFQHFAYHVSQLRFTVMQGFAFKFIKAITKYDQSGKRDGSVISILRDSNLNKLVTDEEQVHFSLLNYMKSRDLRLTPPSFSGFKTPYSLPPLETCELRA